MELVKHPVLTLKAWAGEYGARLFIFSLMLLMAVLLMPGCGVSSKDEPQAPQPPPPRDEAWEAVKVVIDRNCTPCHNGTIQPLKFDTAAKFKGSQAKAKLKANLMPPPPKVISAEDKQKLLAYLGG